MSSQHEPNTKPVVQAPATLRDLLVPLAAEEILRRLDEAARRGKLPGFAAAAPGREVLFTLTDFGSPFESVLAAAATAEGSATRLRFSIRLKPVMPAVFAIMLVITIWPGVWLTDSLLRTYSSWYMSLPDWATYAWYLPLTVPFCPPAMLAALRKSRASAAAEAQELIDKLAAIVGGRPA